MKKLFLVSLASFGLLLSGCGQSSNGNNVAANGGSESIENSSVDLSSYPEGVQNGTVSVEYHQKFTEWADTNASLAKQMEFYKIDGMTEYQKKKDNLEKQKEILHDIKLNNENFDPSYSTLAEENMNKTIFNYKYNMELYYEYLIKKNEGVGSNSGDMAKRYLQDFKEESDYLVRQTKEYGIY